MRYGCPFFPACTRAPKPIHPPDTSGIFYPDTDFLVVSDLHFYDTSLGTEGEAFQAYLDRDRKLLTLSGEILETAVARMAAEKADFVLVSGDLTKDGETICHQGAAERLRPLLAAGKKVIVVPGNHDIANTESLGYAPAGTRSVPNITPEDFKEIYRDFGYADALFQDPGSLSYVTEPRPGLWILALDANRYRENKVGHEPVVGGALSKETLAWIEARLAQARTEGKAVITLLHHGIMEHYPANDRFYGRYLVEDHDTLRSLLASYGVRLTFTGHFHSQDITLADVPTTDGKAHRIFDIETGSLVTAPCPYRQVKISGGKARITSQFITAIPSMGDAFEAHARDNVFTGTVKLADAELNKYWVSETEQKKIDYQIAAAYVTHLKGDEVRPATAIDSQDFGPWLNIVAWVQKDLLEGWYTDLPPADNHLTIDLATGAVD